MKREIFIFCIIAALFLSLGLYFGVKKAEPEVVPDAGTQLFKQALPDASGTLHELSKWKGHILLVNFWATWCPPCVEEMPELSELQEEKSFKNLQILGIGVDSPSNIRDFAAKYKISYPLYVAGMGGGELSKALGNQHGGLPFTLLIDSSGQINKAYLGRLQMETVRKDIAALAP